MLYIWNTILYINYISILKIKKEILIHLFIKINSSVTFRTGNQQMWLIKLCDLRWDT